MTVTINDAKYWSTRITVALGILLVFWQLCINPLSPTFQLLFFTISIFAFGIQHGALDHLVDAEIARQKQTHFHIAVFLAKYGLLMLIYALLWYLFPQISFVIFILMSGWHFGETDIIENNTPFIAVAKLVYGVSVIVWILFSHPKEAGDIISRIVPANKLIYRLWLAAANHSYGIRIVCGIIILSILFTSRLIHKSPQSIGLLINLLLILTCCAVLPLLPSFALYFAGWHSVITLYNITAFTQKESGDGKERIVIWKLWLKALPLSTAAIAGLLITGYLLQHHAPLFEPLPLLFVFLSLITLPHMSVMHQLNKKLFY